MNTSKYSVRLCFITFLTFLWIAPVNAVGNRYSATTISFGGYQSTAGTDTLTGSQLAISYLHQFADQWAYFFRVASGNAEGQHTENNVTTELSASTTTFTGGVQWSYDLDINSDQNEDLTPYLGIGISIQNYRYDLDYEESDIGETTGTGYGPFLSAGLKIAISPNIVLIPGYHYDQINIETEDNTEHTVTSSGFSLALVARF